MRLNPNSPLMCLLILDVEDLVLYEYFSGLMARLKLDYTRDDYNFLCK